MLKFLEMDKKGVDITFNWIFVIIAGTILLLFLIYFSWKQIGLFNIISINEVVDSINNEITAFSIGISSNKIVNLPKDVIFKFKCGDVIYKNTRKDTFNLIYGEGNFKDSFLLWTNSWVFPFKIDNLYYAINLNKKIFIIGNENMFFNLPDRFTKFNKLNDEIKKEDVIVDFTNSKIFNKFKENKILDVDKEKSIITFYPEEKKEEFYGEAMIYGAVFSDYEDYICLKKKSLQKLDLISKLYKKKSEYLESNSKCSFQYDQIEKTLDLFKVNPIKYQAVLIEQNDQIKRNGCISVF